MNENVTLVSTATSSARDTLQVNSPDFLPFYTHIHWDRQSGECENWRSTPINSQFRFSSKTLKIYLLSIPMTYRLRYER